MGSFACIKRVRDHDDLRTSRKKGVKDRRLYWATTEATEKSSRCFTESMFMRIIGDSSRNNIQHFFQIDPIAARKSCQRQTDENDRAHLRHIGIFPYLIDKEIFLFRQ